MVATFLGLPIHLHKGASDELDERLVRVQRRFDDSLDLFKRDRSMKTAKLREERTKWFAKKTPSHVHGAGNVVDTRLSPAWPERLDDRRGSQRGSARGDETEGQGNAANQARKGCATL